MQNVVQLLIPETVRTTVFLVKKVTLTFLDDISPECLETVVPRESTFSGQMVWKCESVEFSRQHHAETKGVCTRGEDFDGAAWMSIVVVR